MSSRIINTPNAPAPVGPYNQAVVYNGILYASGQIALDPKTGHMNNATFSDEVHQVLQNVQAVLSAANATPASVLKTTVFLTDMATFAEFNAIYDTYFKQPYPARSTIAVAALPKGARIEIEIIAAC